MQNVKIKKEKLLETLRENRTAHREIFLEAQEGFRAEAIKQLDAMLQAAKDGKKIRQSIGLIEPTDQTADYDRAIRMLEMSEDEVIELTELDFECYVLDNWRWKAQFLASNSSYSSTAARLTGKR